MVYGVASEHTRKMLLMELISMPLIRLPEHFIRGVDMPIAEIRKFTSMDRHHTIGLVHLMVVLVYMISNYGVDKVDHQTVEIRNHYSMSVARRKNNLMSQRTVRKKGLVGRKTRTVAV